MRQFVGHVPTTRPWVFSNLHDVAEFFSSPVMSFDVCFVGHVPTGESVQVNPTVGFLRSFSRPCFKMSGVQNIFWRQLLVQRKQGFERAMLGLKNTTKSKHLANLADRNPKDIPYFRVGFVWEKIQVHVGRPPRRRRSIIS